MRLVITIARDDLISLAFLQCIIAMHSESLHIMRDCVPRPGMARGPVRDTLTGCSPSVSVVLGRVSPTPQAQDGGGLHGANIGRVAWVPLDLVIRASHPWCALPFSISL